MYQYVAETSYLLPCDLGMLIGNLGRQVIHCLADYLEVTLNRILCHIRYIDILTSESVRIPSASIDRLQRIGHAPG